MVVKEPPDRVIDRLGRAPKPQREHRRSAGQGLDRHDPEVLDSREEQGPATPQVVADDLVGLPAEEPDRRPRQPLQPGTVGTLADDDEGRPNSLHALTAWSIRLYGTRAETQR